MHTLQYWHQDPKTGSPTRRWSEHRAGISVLWLVLPTHFTRIRQNLAGSDLALGYPDSVDRLDRLHVARTTSLYCLLGKPPEQLSRDYPGHNSNRQAWQTSKCNVSWCMNSQYGPGIADSQGPRQQCVEHPESLRCYVRCSHGQKECGKEHR